MDFESQLSTLRGALLAGGEVNLPEPTAQDELVRLLSALTDLSAGDALLAVANHYCASGLWSPEAALQAAVGLICVGEDKLALTFLAGDELSTPNATACLNVAAAMLEVSQFPLAKRWLKLLASRWPNDYRIDFALGHLHFVQHFRGDALDYFETALQKHPDDFRIQSFMAACCWAVGDRARAVRLTESLLHTAHFVESGAGGLLEACIGCGLWSVALLLLPTQHQLGMLSDWELEATRASAFIEGHLLDAAKATLSCGIIPLVPYQLVLGNLLYEQHEFALAEASYQVVIDASPDASNAHYNQSFARMMQGKWREGWDAYEWRLHAGAGNTAFGDKTTHLSLPCWDGQVTDESVVVCTEQGLGDSIQMLRYLPEVLRRVGGITFELPASLMSLFGAMEMGGEVSSPMQPSKTVTEKAPTLRLPLMSLPHILQQPKPQGAPYIALSEAVRKRTRDWVASRNLRVGLVWSGGRVFQQDHRRSPHLLHLLPLANIPSVTFHILQKGEPLSQLAYAPSHMQIIRTDQQIEDMADLAGIMSHLDLVISTCTMPAHLAGALGVPVWTLLSYTAHFVWMAEGDRTPWYDSMRLFRQRRPGDWAGVVEEVATALHAMAAPDAAPVPPNHRPVYAWPAGVESPTRSADPAFYQAILARDDRHVGAMLGLSRVYLSQSQPYPALFWANEAVNHAIDCIAAWRALSAAMTTLDMPERMHVEDRIAELLRVGASLNWFGWDY